MLDELGFVDALRCYIRGFGQRSGIAIKLMLPRCMPPLPQAVELALFRILQESLNNVRRHAGSPRAQVRLHCGRNIELSVKDNGRGFNVQLVRRNSAGVGLAGMRERVQQLGGTLQVNSGKGGTVIRASIPLADACSLADRPLAAD